MRSGQFPFSLRRLKEAKTRGAAVDALGLIGRGAQPAVPALEEVLNGDDLSARWPAGAALVRIGGPGAKVGARFFLSKASSDGGRELYDAENILVAPAAKEALREMLDAVRDLAVRDTATRIVV